MRLRKRPWIATAIQEYSDIILNLQGEPEQFNWTKIFGRQADLYVELGTGKGKFITEMARLHPENNYIGIEAQHDIIYYAARRAEGLNNVRFLLFDAERIPEIFAPQSVTGLFINFCDPWPKKRHAKRRLTHHRFFPLYRQVLQASGSLCFKTDNRNLFEFSLNEFANEALRLKNIALDLHQQEPEDNVMTEYEEKFSAMGQPIYRCEVFFS